MPTWDEYFFNILEQVKTRSPDPRTHVACIFTKNNRILGTGYNGLSSGLDINITNENKYPFMVHAEQNCVANSTKEENITAYITHLPCHVCLRLMWNYGVRIIKIPANRKVFSYTDDDWTMLAVHIDLGLILSIAGKGYIRLDNPQLDYHDNPYQKKKIDYYINHGKKLKECLTITK